MPTPPLSLAFNLPFSEAIKAAERYTVLPNVYYGQLQGLARQKAFSIAGIASLDQLQAVNDSLAKFMQDGGSFSDWKKQTAVMDLNLPRHRIENIWRTNLQGNYMRGRAEVIYRNAATRPYLLFDSINDSRVRPSHLAHDGVIRPVSDPFWKTHFPPLGYNSLLPTQPISGQFMLGLKARYSGPCVEIRTRSGYHLSLTPNHPVLTNRGWVSAGSLSKSDALLRYRVEVDKCAGVSTDAHNNHSPTTAEQVFKSLRVHGTAVAPRAAFNFDGDIEFIHGDVEIVAANSKLVSDLHSEFMEFADKINLTRTRRRRPLLSRIGDLLSHSLGLAGFGVNKSDFAHFLSHGFNTMMLDSGSVSIGFDPVLFQMLRDPVSGYPKLGGKITQALASPVAFDQFIRDRLPGMHGSRKPALSNGKPIYIGFGSLADSAVCNVPIGGHVTNPNSCADFVEAHPGLVHFDHVANVSFSNFSGHVYDFQSKTGLIVSPDSGLVISNCRCSVISLTESQARARSGFNAQNEGLGLNKVPKHEDGSIAQPDPGWDYHPYEDALKTWQPDPMRYHPKLREALTQTTAIANTIPSIIKVMQTRPQAEWTDAVTALLPKLAEPQVIALIAWLQTTETEEQATQ